MSKETKRIQDFMNSLKTREEFCEVAEYLVNRKYKESLEGLVNFKVESKIFNLKLVEYTGAKPTCQCGKDGKLRLMYLADRKEASKNSYISCDKCFNETWAGEN